MNEFATSPSESASAAAIALWPADLLARHLVSGDPVARTIALGMAVQPGAPVNQCVEALVSCANLSLGNPLASQLTATALGCLTPERASLAVHGSLAALAADKWLPTRIAAAHAMFRLRCLPTPALDPVCCLLFESDPNARKVALLAVTPFAASAAATIAGCISRTQAEHWTSEALLALARSAGNDAAARRSVDGFVMRSLAGKQLVPSGIAGYAALAQLNPQGAAIPALAQIAANANDAVPSNSALDVLGDLGETARPVARRIAELLLATNDPAREELICRTLVKLRPAHRDVPIGHVLQRVASAPDRGTAAHCMLLCLHPKEFAQAATVIRQRFVVSADALKQVLSQTHKVLTGGDLGGVNASTGS
jgi:hypothetical protein